jgi:hypothetical protein
MKLDCGHEPIDGRWVTVFLPNPEFPYHRFCDLACVHFWIEQEWERILQEIRDEEQEILAEQKE